MYKCKSAQGPLIYPAWLQKKRLSYTSVNRTASVGPVRWYKLTQGPFRSLPASTAALKVRIQKRLHRRQRRLDITVIQLNILSQDGRMGHDGRRSSCFGRRIDAESTGEVASETAVATTGVAMTTGRCICCAARFTLPERLGKRLQVRIVLGRYTIYADRCPTLCPNSRPHLVNHLPGR